MLMAVNYCVHHFRLFYTVTIPFSSVRSNVFFNIYVSVVTRCYNTECWAGNILSYSYA